MKLLCLAGSSRKDSFNKKLAKLASIIALENNIEATFIDLKDYPMPLYDGDLEDASGVPEKTIALKQLFVEHDALFIASPEYNSSISPLLKNTLDWLTRKHEDNEPDLVAFKDKVVGLGAASPGALGGLRGLVTVRMFLGNIGAFVIPNQVAVPAAMKAFDEEGNFVDEGNHKRLASVIEQLISTAKKLNA